jgi:hypothetical protein
LEDSAPFLSPPCQHSPDSYSYVFAPKRFDAQARKQEAMSVFLEDGSPPPTAGMADEGK